MEEAGSGRASPDMGQIRPSRLAGQPGVRSEPVRCLGRSIRRRSTAGVRRPRWSCMRRRGHSPATVSGKKAHRGAAGGRRWLARWLSGPGGVGWLVDVHAEAMEILAALTRS
jgi:hypothetical protein